MSAVSRNLPLRTDQDRSNDAALALSRTPQRRQVLVAGVYYDGLNGIDRAGAAIRVSYLLGVLVWAFAVAWSTGLIAGVSFTPFRATGRFLTSRAAS